MKIRLAKKIMKSCEATPIDAKRYSIYWVKIWFNGNSAYKDHRITKAISLTSKKKKV